MRTATALVALVLVVALPVLALSAQFPTYYPPGAFFAASAFTSSSIDGTNHALLGVNQANADLYMVFLSPSGAPAFAALNGFPWGYGRLVSAQFISPTVVRATWLIIVSAGGTNAMFFDGGTVAFDFLL